MTASPAGHLCIDLSQVNMTGHQQRDLLRRIETTVVDYLAAISSQANVVSITLSPDEMT